MGDQQDIENSALFTVGDMDDEDDTDDLDPPFGMSASLSNSGLIDDSYHTDIMGDANASSNGTGLFGNIDESEKAQNTYKDIPEKVSNFSAQMAKKSTEVIQQVQQRMETIDFYRNHKDPIVTSLPSTALQNSNQNAPQEQYRQPPNANGSSYSNAQVQNVFSSGGNNFMDRTTNTSNQSPIGALGSQNQISKGVMNYRNVTVEDPRLVTKASVGALFSKGQGGGYWVYPIATTFPDDEIIRVERRFSEFLALEKRIRAACLGAILPPRPDKKNSIDETGLQGQNLAFAQARAKEVQTYIRALCRHPYASVSPPLQTFLSVPFLGSLWPEVSESTFTRLSTFGTTAVLKLSEQTADLVKEQGLSYGGKQVVLDQMELGNPRVATTVQTEELRLKTVAKSIPAIVSLTEKMILPHAQIMLGMGIETSKCYKGVQTLDKDLSVPLEILATSLLRDGRRSKRLSLQLHSYLQPFEEEHRRMENTMGAIDDRRNALLKLKALRDKVQGTPATMLMSPNQRLPGAGQSAYPKNFNPINTAAAAAAAAVRTRHDPSNFASGNWGGDGLVTICEKEVDEVSRVLTEEIQRIAELRRKNYILGITAVAKEWKECCGERKIIWENAKKAAQYLPS